MHEKIGRRYIFDKQHEFSFSASFFHDIHRAPFQNQAFSKLSFVLLCMNDDPLERNR